MATNRYLAPRIRIPDILERGRAYNAELPIYRNGALVAPDSGTFRLVDANGADIVAESSVTITADIATYAILAGDLPSTLDFSDSYMMFWKLTIAGEVHEFKRPCALARSAIYPVVSDLDLEAEYSSIDNLLKSPATTFQDKIDEAWVRVIQRVRDQGNLEYLIMSPESLRSCHLNLTLYLIFKDASSTGMGLDNTYMDHAREHRSMYENDFKRLQFKYDINEDGKVDKNKRAGYPVIFTNKPPRFGINRRYGRRRF